LSVDANVSEKHTVSIFRAGVEMLGSGGICIRLEEGKAEGVGFPFLQLSIRTVSSSPP
jgi:hypothetical protein